MSIGANEHTGANVMNHKELTAHIRNRIKAAGIKAKCKMQEYNGCQVISIDVPEYNAEFSEEEQRQIRLIAKCNKLTFARGMEIDMERMTNPKEFKFFLTKE